MYHASTTEFHMIKLFSQQKALDRLKKLKSDFRSEITETYEHRAKSCLTCETRGACCLDAHFVNVHISRLETAAIKHTISTFSREKQNEILGRIDAAISKYGLTSDGDTYAQAFACPLFEKGTGCLVHEQGKPIACITHACYENKADLPPDEMLAQQESLVDDLNTRTYGRSQQWLPLPLAIRRAR